MVSYSNPKVVQIYSMRSSAGTIIEKAERRNQKRADGLKKRFKIAEIKTGITESAQLSKPM